MEGASNVIKRKSTIILLIFALIVCFSSFYTLPYYVSRPGMAKELDELIDVQDGYDEDGAFMLTTVRMGKANIIFYLLSKFNKYYELHPISAVKAEDETDEEYNIRQLYYMENSQENALQVAFKYANKSYDVKNNGIYVLNVIEGLPADGKLKPGDRIFQIDDEVLETSESFIQYVQAKSNGDTITVHFERDGVKQKTEIKIDILPETNKPGIGIALVEDKEVETDPKVTIKTDDIGGPSAGFMFSLEIYNQLIQEDITKGYKIAGTGTISEDGTIGRIGGIEQKVVAAHKAGAEIFFAPNENGSADSNYRAAVKTAKDIDTKMKIVPVDTFEDAIEYLKNLKAK